MISTRAWNRWESRGALLDSLFKLKQNGAVEEARKAVNLWKELRASGRLTAADAFSTALNLRSLAAVLGSTEKQEAVALARETLAELRRVFGGLPPEDDNNMYVALALAVLGGAELAAGNHAESRRTYDEALVVAKPVIHVPAASVVTAHAIARFTRLVRIDRLDRGNCAEVREWWRQEIEVWRTLASKSEYAAMRLQLAENDAPACQVKP